MQEKIANFPHMFKYLFSRDTVFATAAVFVVMALLAMIPLNTHVLDPFKLALADFDFNDMAYSRLGKNNGIPADTQIVVVNIENADRKEIAGLIKHIALGSPKVIGADILFQEAKEPNADSLLTAAITENKNLVLASYISNDQGNISAKGYFYNDAAHNGYANFIGEEGGVIRYFSPLIKDGTTYTSFAAAIVQLANPEKYDQLIKRNNEAELINYLRTEENFVVIDGSDILSGAADIHLFKDKIVLLGFVSPDSRNIEDKHFTPRNPKFTGKAIPDMNGVFIHANILGMVLSGKYINKTPAWASWLLALVLCWLHMAFFIGYFLHKHIWFHLAAKIAQIVSAVFFVYLGLLFYYKFDTRIDMAGTLAAIILAVDVLYFYEAFAVWLHKKRNYKTIFQHEAHH